MVSFDCVWFTFASRCHHLIFPSSTSAVGRRLHDELHHGWAGTPAGELRRVDPPCTAGRCGPWEGTEELDSSSELAVMSGGSGFG